MKLDENSASVDTWLVDGGTVGWSLAVRSLPVIERLQDNERSGVPAKFSRSQVVQLFALACSEPAILWTTY